MPEPEPQKDVLKLAGERLGPYVVLEVSTVGGVAIIYRGEHETLHNEVAIKVLTPEVASDEARSTLEQLFMREAQILSQLRSEDILRAHDLGKTVCPSDGRERPYMVVDWLRGKTLAEAIDLRSEHGEPPFGLLEIVELLDPIARALDYAHSNGIVHRDVNPRNIFLEEKADGTIHAKLIDFGFAKDVAKTNLTIQRVAGTLLARSPDYSAPEHYDREKYGDLSEMTDLYTLALTVVEALTLELPLRGATPEAQMMSTSDPNLRPTPRNRGAQVSDPAEALFAQALAVDQFERPSSTREWWEALREAARAPVVPSAAPPKFEPPPEMQVVVDSIPPPARAPRRGVRIIGWLLAGLVFVLGVLGVLARFLPWPLSCPADRGDCNQLAYDACETDLGSDDGHCGGCGKKCAAGNARALCTDGQCKIVSCVQTSHRDCNANAADGCEIDVESDTRNCGECGKTCDPIGTKRAGCVNGSCEVVCAPGFGDCDGKSESGCETKLLDNAKHCGRCGFVCRDGRCEDGLCTPKIVASVQSAEHLVSAGGRLVFWDRDQKQLKSSVDGGAPSVLVPAPGVVSVAMGKDIVVWTTDKPAAVWAISLANDKPTPKQVAGPLPKPSPLVVDATHSRVSWWAVPAGSPIGPLTKPNSVTTAPLDASLLSGAPTPSDCKTTLAAFAGDENGQLFCAPAGPLTALECKGSVCKQHRYRVKCAESITVDASYVYWVQDVRVMALDRKSGKARQIAKHGKPTRELSFDADYVYWLEGEPDADVLRVKKPQPTTTAPEPELLARAQAGAAELSVDEKGIYWTRKTSDGVAIVLLAK